MNRRLIPLACGFLALLIATGCGLLGPLQSMDVEPGFDPAVAGFEVNDDGEIEIAAHVVTFQSARGSLGGIVTGYEVEYFDATGQPLVAGDSVVRSRGSLSHPVPAGVVCEESVPCTLNAPDATFERQESEPRENFFVLSGEAATVLLASGQGSARAEITFYVTDTNGVDHTLVREVAISYPVEP